MDDRVQGSVLIFGIIPWRRMSISSLGCLGGKRYFPHFPALLPGVARETQLAYVQRYVHLEVHSSSEFQVHGGQLQISSFGREDVRYMCLILSHCHNIALMGTH
jgi:hypothetical protein